MADTTRSALVIVSYGSAALVEENAAQLSSDWPELSVVVVDCFTSDAERSRVRDMCSRRSWTAVLLDENLGFGGGVGRGADAALELGADVLIVLNPDAVLAATDARMLAAAAADAPNALVAPVIRRPDGTLWTEGTDLYLDDGTMAGVRHRKRHEGRPRMFWVSGACFAISRTLWEHIGGFDDAYFLYWEDVDLSKKVWDAGGEVRVLQTASAVHDEGGRTRTAPADGRSPRPTTTTTSATGCSSPGSGWTRTRAVDGGGETGRSPGASSCRAVVGSCPGADRGGHFSAGSATGAGMSPARPRARRDAARRPR